ncbi:hypothetical protein ABPG75_007590 [Micractinium tetrahymenae]
MHAPLPPSLTTALPPAALCADCILGTSRLESGTRLLLFYDLHLTGHGPPPPLLPNGASRRSRRAAPPCAPAIKLPPPPPALLLRLLHEAVLVPTCSWCAPLCQSTPPCRCRLPPADAGAAVERRDTTPPQPPLLSAAAQARRGFRRAEGRRGSRVSWACRALLPCTACILRLLTAGKVCFLLSMPACRYSASALRQLGVEALQPEDKAAVQASRRAGGWWLVVCRLHEGPAVLSPPRAIPSCSVRHAVAPAAPFSSGAAGAAGCLPGWR